MDACIEKIGLHYSLGGNKRVARCLREEETRGTIDDCYACRRVFKLNLKIRDAASEDEKDSIRKVRNPVRRVEKFLANVINCSMFINAKTGKPSNRKMKDCFFNFVDISFTIFFNLIK